MFYMLVHNWKIRFKNNLINNNFRKYKISRKNSTKICKISLL